MVEEEKLNKNLKKEERRSKKRKEESDVRERGSKFLWEKGRENIK